MASGTEIERLFVKIEGDIAGLKASMSKARAEVHKGEKDMGGPLERLAMRFTSVQGAAVAVGGAVGLAAAALLRGAQVAVKYADDLNDTAVALGINVERLQEYRFAAQQNGVSTEELDKALMKLNVTIGEAARGDEAAQDKFAKLGIAIKDTAGKTRDSGEVFRDVVDKVSKIPNAAERAAAAADLMGGNLGPKLSQFLGVGIDRLDELANAARTAGAVMDAETIERAAKAQDELDAMGTVIKAQLSTALVELAPILVTVANCIADVARGASIAATALKAMLGASPFPLEKEVRSVAREVEELQKKLDDKYVTTFLWTPEEVAQKRAELKQLQQDLADLKAKQEALMVAAGPSQAKPAGAAAPGAGKDQQKATDAALSAEQRAYEERLAAQRSFFQMLAGNEKAALEERVANLQKVTEIEISLENAAYQRKLQDLSKLEATTDEQKAALAGAREEAELAHRTRLEEIERGSHDRIKTMRDTEAEEERQRGAERQAWFEDQVELDNERMDAIAEANAERLKSKIELDQAGLEEYKRLRAEGMATDEEVVAFQARLDAQRYSAARDALGNLATLMGAQSRKMFEVGKAAAISQTIIDTYAAAQSAYKAMAGIPIVGPALGVAAAAAAIASGLVRVQAIKSAQFGNRSVSVGVGGGVTVGTGDAAAPGGAGGGGGGPSTYIYLPPGQGFYSTDMVRQLMERISEVLGDGGSLKVIS